MTRIKDKEYYRAIEVLEKYKRENIGSPYKWRRKEGVKYIRCQHLKEGTQSEETSNLWVGDNLRVICCPICTSVRVGGFVRLFGIDPNYEPPEEDKKEIRENWKTWLVGLFKR